MKESYFTYLVIILLFVLAGCSFFRNGFGDISVNRANRSYPHVAADGIVTLVKLADLADRKLARTHNRPKKDIRGQALKVFTALDEKLEPLCDAVLTTDEVKGYLDGIDIAGVDKEIVGVVWDAIVAKTDTQSITAEGATKECLIGIYQIVSLVKGGLR